MAEKILQSKLYEYRANSNLVLESDRDSRRRNDEGKGEVESLKPRVGSIKMGERISGRNQLNSELPLKKRKLDEISGNKAGPLFKPQLDTLDKVVYVPKSVDCRQAYEEFLTILRRSLGDVSNEMLKGAATELLEILKDREISPSSQKSEIQRLSADLDDEQFRQLLSTSKRITDFESQVDVPSESVPMEEGMAVVFDDEADIDELVDDDGGEDDFEVDQPKDSAARQLKAVGQTEDDENSNSNQLSVHQIDAYWLQRQLSKYYDDPNICSKLADEVLSILSERDERTCENNLVTLLDFDRFSFIKVLLAHRHKIYHCIRLKQAQSEEDRIALEDEMKKDVEFGGYEVWTLLNEHDLAESWTKDRIGMIAQKARREAQEIAKLGNQDKDFVDAMSHIQNSVDLDYLSFKEGGHFMANTRCELPDKSWRAQKKGYEEVHVPAIKPVINESEKLVGISSLPDWMHCVFDGVRTLNRIQSKMCKSALQGTDNMLLCAPTGSGKTNVALLCMLGVIAKYRSDTGHIGLKDFKIIYIAPMKALVQECVQNFSKRLNPLNMSVRELSGDQSLSSREILDTTVIVTTPEKWDVVTRKSMDRSFTQLVKLVIIDEIHLLHDDRGPVLEGLVARTLRQSELDGDPVRIVGLSATLPNYEDVAAFLRVDSHGLFYFDSSYRPVPLQQQFIGITEKKVLKKVQIMNEICYEKALLHAGKNQILIFTHSRADTVKTAKALRDLAISNDTLNKFVKEDSASSEILRSESANVKSNDLKDLLSYGFAVHHAGLQRSDRSLVEDLFADRHIQVLVSTATLAWGVNLPCHTVIIKGTQIYSPEKGCWAELSPLDILQMIGRAGRYGLDSEGEGIIITSHTELQYYLSLVNNQLPIESQFVKRLPDLLNAEIVAGSIGSVEEAAEWLGYTYLYVRMLKNPQLYGVDPAQLGSDKTLFQWRLRLAGSALRTLEKNDLIKFDRKSGSIISTYLGRISSYFYITNETMATYKMHMRPSMNEIDILRLFGLSSEFKYIYVKEEEKMELSKLLGRVPVPIKESAEEPVAKINVLLQAYISRMRLDGYAIVSDMIFIQQSAGRLMRAMFEISLAMRWASVASKILDLCGMVERRMWCSQNALRQFHAVPETIVRKLERISDISWEKYLDLKPQDLGEIVKNPRMGKTLYKFVHMLPKLSITVHAVPISRAWLQLDVQLSADFEYNEEVHGSSILFWLFVEDCDGEQILYYEPVFFRGETVHLHCSVKLMEPLAPQYFIKIVSDRWLHSNSEVPLSFRHLILPEKFNPSTELLDLRSIPVATLSKAHQLFLTDLHVLNPIQTQLFFHLNDSDDSLLVLAPARAGKLACAEIALIRFLTSSPQDQRCLVLVPDKERGSMIFNKWAPLINQLYGVEACLLTGDSVVDMSMCKQAKVIVSDPSHWDSLSKKWRSRKVVQQISLYLLCDLHALGEHGSTYEVVLSRSRFIESQLGKQVRYVGMGYPIANAIDLSDWLGISKNSTFSFSQQSTDKADVQIIVSDNNDPINRVCSMSKMLFRSMRNGSGSTIIFVPHKKIAQLLAVDFLCLSKKSNTHFNLAKVFDDWKGCNFTDASKDLLSNGIGVVHRGLSIIELEAVQRNLAQGNLWVVLVPFECLGCTTLRADSVFITDTVVYDGKIRTFVDLEREQLIAMSSAAQKKCRVHCHSSKKEQIELVFFEPFPLESSLAANLHNHLVGEIVNRTVESKAEAVDYLTWSFYYRRLSKNPNFYNISGSSIRHISDHLSELVETVVADLEQSKFIMVENDMEISPLNLAMIASHYNLHFLTIELFATTLTHKSRVRGITDVLIHAKEFDSIPVRIGEDQIVLQLVEKFQLVSSADRSIQQSKLLALLNSHFSRVPLSGELSHDLKLVLEHSVNFVHSIVDVLSSQGWLKPTLAAMELSQMLVQGMWDKDDVLMQIPHVVADTIYALHQLEEQSVETIFDLLDLPDDVKLNVLQLGPSQMSDVATFCNAYPTVEMTYKLSFDDAVEPGSQQTICVEIDRDISGFEDSMESIGRVVSNRYPLEKIENWWVVVGESTTNMLLSIKRFTLIDHSKVKLDFIVPDAQGVHKVTIFLMCDSYLGVDQEYSFEFNVV